MRRISGKANHLQNLLRSFGLLVGILFIQKPVSLNIKDYHRQLDNLAILGVTSPITADQYPAIVIPFISVYFNFFFYYMQS